MKPQAGRALVSQYSAPVSSGVRLMNTSFTLCDILNLQYDSFYFIHSILCVPKCICLCHMLCFLSCLFLFAELAPIYIHVVQISAIVGLYNTYMFVFRCA